MGQNSKRNEHGGSRELHEGPPPWLQLCNGRRGPLAQGPPTLATPAVICITHGHSGGPSELRKEPLLIVWVGLRGRGGAFGLDYVIASEAPAHLVMNTIECDCQEQDCSASAVSGKCVNSHV